MKTRWPDAYKIIEKLEEAGFEAFVVGGAVRDYIRGVEANDVDITTNALPDQIQELFSNTIDVGIEHGTVIVVWNTPIEVTTYRSESTYTDHRRPDHVTFVRSLKEDLKRRDFTMNAMALTKNDEIIDFFRGQKDIEEKIIRAVGEPSKRFSEDALRMLRAVRFSAQLGFQLEEATYQGIKELAPLLSHVSIERVKVELEKIWVSPHPAHGMRLFIETGLADCLKGNWTETKHAWNHFNSFGDKKNGWAFFFSLQEGAGIEELLSYYKCSNEEKRHVRQVLRAMDELKKGPWTATHFFHYKVEVLQAAQAYSSESEIFYTLEELSRIKQELPIQSVKELAVNGNDLMEWTGKKRGPWIKEVLEHLIHDVLTNQVANDIASIKEWLKHEQPNEENNP